VYALADERRPVAVAAARAVRGEGVDGGPQQGRLDLEQARADATDGDGRHGRYAFHADC
jgi:hypothetical protein